MGSPQAGPLPAQLSPKQPSRSVRGGRPAQGPDQAGPGRERSTSESSELLRPGRASVAPETRPGGHGPRPGASESESRFSVERSAARGTAGCCARCIHRIRCGAETGRPGPAPLVGRSITKSGCSVTVGIFGADGCTSYQRDVHLNSVPLFLYSFDLLCLCVRPAAVTGQVRHLVRVTPAPLFRPASPATRAVPARARPLPGRPATSPANPSARSLLSDPRPAAPVLRAPAGVSRGRVARHFSVSGPGPGLCRPAHSDAHRIGPSAGPRPWFASQGPTRARAALIQVHLPRVARLHTAGPAPRLRCRCVASASGPPHPAPSLARAGPNPPRSEASGARR